MHGSQEIKMLMQKREEIMTMMIIATYLDIIIEFYVWFVCVILLFLFTHTIFLPLFSSVWKLVFSINVIL